MKKTALFSVLVLALVLACASSALSATWTNFDFLRFAKEQVLTDFHPTAKPEDATSDYYQEPEEKDGVVTARVNVFYSGWIRKHTMLVQVDLKSEDGLVKVTLLSDTNSIKKPANPRFPENSWVELSSLNWK